MSKYLVQANYVGQGIGGLIKEGASGRRAAVDSLLASVDAKVEADFNRSCFVARVYSAEERNQLYQK